MIKRTIETKIKDALLKYPIVTLTGPRQSGKTTLLKTVFNQYQYISLENPDIKDYAENDPRGFLSEFNNHIIFDEIQRCPHLFSYLQQVTDDRREPGQFILSGSQNFLLMDSISQSLAGRIAIFKLLPFSIEELKQNDIKPDLNTILINGLYPPIYDRGHTPSEWYQDYIETYLEKDIRQIKNIHNLSLFRKFLSLLALRNGQVLNATNIAEDCGISPNTIRDWISILETSYIIHQSTPYSTQESKRLIKSPKIFFYDPGLLAYLLGITPNNLMTMTQKGSLFESLILSECAKYHYNLKKRFNPLFYRDRNNHEIDLMFSTNITQILIELKSSSTISQEFLTMSPNV